MVRDVFVPENKDGNRWTVPARIGDLIEYPDGRIEHVKHGLLIDKNGAVVADIKGQTSQLVDAGLAAGKAVAEIAGPGSIVVKDPRDFETDDACLQALADGITGSTTRVGRLHVPARRPDGTNWTIESTVTCGLTDGTAIVVPVFHGFGRAEHADQPRIETTITDGSPMFLLTGDVVNENGINHPGAFGGFFHLGGQNAVGIRTQFVGGWTLHPDYMQATSNALVEVDAHCWGWGIDGAYSPDNGDGVGIALTNHNGVSGAVNGNAKLSDTILIDSTMAAAVRSTVQTRDLHIGGYYEARGTSSGRAVIDVDAAGSEVTLEDSAHIVDSSGSMHGLYFNGLHLQSNPAMIKGAGVDALHIGPDAVGWTISPLTRYSGISGDSIHLETTPGTTSTVPYPTQVEGSVTYPNPFGPNMFYPDGWSRQSTGTTTVPGGGTAEIGYAPDGQEISLHMEIQTGGRDVDWYRRRDSGGTGRIVLEEKSGSGDVTVDHEVLRRPRVW